MLIIWVLSNVFHQHVLVKSLDNRCLLTRISHLDFGHVVVVIMEIVVVLRKLITVHVPLDKVGLPNSSLRLCIFFALLVHTLVIFSSAASTVLRCLRKLLTALFGDAFSLTFHSFE